MRIKKLCLAMQNLLDSSTFQPILWWIMGSEELKRRGFGDAKPTAIPKGEDA
jgi:hypothetical protein